MSLEDQKDKVLADNSDETEAAETLPVLEAIPEGSTLFIQNQDQPGVVGSVGTVLGQGGINISRMQLALIPERSLAAMLVNIDRAPEEAVMKQLRSLPHLISAQLVELGS